MWLSGSTEGAFKLARSCAAEQMRIGQFGAEREDLLRVAQGFASGGEMIKIYATRLMRTGEVALWRHGVMVWSGAVGTLLSGVNFDTVCLHIEDSTTMAARLPKRASAEEVLAALAEWWAEEAPTH